MTYYRTHDVTVPWTHSLSRSSSRKLQLDLVLAFLLACGVFILYTRTLVPSVLDGDQGEFQYIPSVLGIPHPSGFPLYLLLGRLWSALPIGTLAYRMNLLSAFFGALTVAALYLALRSQKLLLLASLGASLTLALIPQFWEYSTVAAVYRLHDFLIVLLFAFLAQWEAARNWHWLELAALAFGLDLANHLTIVFFAPATLVLVLMVSGRALFKEIRVIITAGLLLLLPLALYVYFPLRGLQLLTNNFVLPGWNLAVAQGIVSPFYDGSPTGVFQYFVGGTFFQSVTGHLQWKWDTLIPDWTAIVLQTVNWQVVALSLIGVVWLALRRAKIAIWLVLVVVTFQLIALQYSYAGLAAIGQFSSYFSEYYLPSFIAMIILAAWGIDGAIRGMETLTSRVGVRSQLAASSVSALILAAFLIFTIADLSAHRSDALASRSAEIQAKWDSVQRFPPDQGAALVGHWGDLTPLWYYQYADGWRRDLVTINPPDEGRVDAWIATGKPLYIAGSLLDWAPGIAPKYHLTPWGSIVRVTLESYAPASPLTHEADWTFEADRPMLKLSGFDVSPAILRVGESLDLAAYWQVLQSMRIDDATIYISLDNAQDDAHSQSYAFVVNWLPGGRLAAGQRALGTYSYTVPWGTHPGTYQLHLSIYSARGGRTLNAVSKEESLRAVDLGQVTVKPALYYPATAMTDHPANADFGNRVVLLGWDGDLGQVTQGDTHKPAIPLESRKRVE